MSGNVSFIAWKVSRNFTPLWHRTIDNRFTRCGKRPSDLLSVWGKPKPPPVELQCKTCRVLEARERNVHAR